MGGIASTQGRTSNGVFVCAPASWTAAVRCRFGNRFQGLESLTAEHVAPAALFLASKLCADRTGQVLAVSGSRMYVFKVVEGKGTFKDENAVWTAEEIAEHWDAISRS